jgi:hypothetical protein
VLLSGKIVQVVLTILFAQALSGCTLGSSDRSSQTVEEGIRALPLRVFAVQTPRLQLPNYKTKGSYPHVARSNVRVQAVNRALDNAVLNAERKYARAARPALRRVPDSIQRTQHGVFQTFLTAELISASTVVVSTLMPVLELLPGGNDGATWLSSTVQVPSGVTVEIDDLFTKGAGGLVALARAVRVQVSANNRCVRRALVDPIASEDFEKGFHPRVRNYEQFALVPRGLAVGFPNGQVAYPACGRVEATVPYSTLRPYLNDLGARLVAGVRRPR